MTVETREFIFTNFASSTLAAAIDADDTEIELVSGSKFPLPDDSLDQVFPLIVWTADLISWEVMYGISRNGNILTVERGKEGSTARSFSAGAIVIHNVTAEYFEQRVLSVQGAPSAVVLSGQVSGEDYLLSWTASMPHEDTTVAAYNIYVSDDGNTFTLLDSVNGAVLEYLDTSFSVGNSYQVKAVSSLGLEGPASNIITTLTPANLILVYRGGSDNQAVALSTDGGSSFTLVDAPDSATWSRIVVLPDKQKIQLIDEGQETCNSEDGGQTWGSVNTNAGPGSGTSVIFPGLPVYAEAFDLMLIPTTNQQFQSANPLSSMSPSAFPVWSNNSLWGEAGGLHGRSIAYSPDLERALFVASSQFSSAVFCCGYTTDGETFTESTIEAGGETLQTTAVAVWDPAHSQFCILRSPRVGGDAEPAEVYLSADGSHLTYEGKIAGFPGDVLVVGMIYNTNDQKLYTLLADGQYASSEDGGLTWSLLGTLTGTSWRVMKWDPISKKAFVLSYALGDDTLLSTSDFQTWTTHSLPVAAVWVDFEFLT